jgi:ribosomal protein S18 acetylase RimI-like enzyme
MEPLCYIQIRKIKNSEIPLILGIERRCFTGPRAYTRSQFDYLVKRANSICLVALVDSVIRGFIIVIFRKNKACAMIETLDVDPDHRNQGIGSTLLREAEREIQGRGIKLSQLEVSERNENAIWVYKRAGYQVSELLNCFYQYENMGSRNAIRMIRALG